MEIQIRYVGKSNVLGLERGAVISVEQGSTISDVLSGLKVQKEFHEFVVPLVNGAHRSLTYVLEEGDELDFFLPVSGG